MPVASVPRNSTRRPPSAVSLGTISRNWFGLDPVAVVFVPRSMLTCGCSNARPASSRPGIILPDYFTGIDVYLAFQFTKESTNVVCPPLS